MSNSHCPNVEYYVYEQPADFNHFLLKQNWTSSLLREEAAILNKLVTGHEQPPSYVTDTETQREYRNPNVKSIEHLKHIEKNRYGRYAHTPDQPPPNGILPTFNAKMYLEVVPRFHLPKMPY